MAIKSINRLTHDPAGAPTVLLDYGDLTDAFIALPAQQQVAEIPGLRVAGIDTAARGNESHTLSIAKVVKMTSGVAAALLMLRHSGTVPKYTADIKIEVDGHTTSYWLLRNCTVSAYPAETRAKDTVMRYEYKGGRLDEVTV